MILLLGMLSTDFYPRPPRGGRRKIISILVPGEDISIHALREEGDLILILLAITPG